MSDSADLFSGAYVREICFLRGNSPQVNQFFRELMARDNRAIGTLIPNKNCGYHTYNENLQFTLEVPNEQDVWFQTMMEMETVGQYWKESNW